MPLFDNFIAVFVHYVHEIWWVVLLGFFISGIFYHFIPTSLVERHLGGRGLRPVLWASLVGTALPVCCFGVLPIAVTLKKKGARLGPILAFLVTTPATSISALLVTWKLLGGTFAVYIFFAVILMGLVMGFIGNYLRVPERLAGGEKAPSCCEKDGKLVAGAGSEPFARKIKGVFIYTFIRLPKEIGLELLLGLAVASFIVAFEPIQNFIHHYLTGFVGYLAIIVVSLFDYVCSTASVPLAQALGQSGMSPGHVMLYLLLGPITSSGTIFVLKKEFGWKIMVVYLISITILSLVLGISFDFLFFVRTFPIPS